MATSKAVSAQRLRPLKSSRATQRELLSLSPFELKDELIKLSNENSRQGDYALLNAGRGNPNWIATTPRQSFFLLGQFAITESERVWKGVDLGGMPAKDGIAKRLSAFLKSNAKKPGAALLGQMVNYGVRQLKFNADAFVHELVDAIIGDNYPVPDRVLVHTEKVVQAYLDQEMCDNKPPKGKFDIFAVEGGTAAMCYIFDSLETNGLLKKGDTVALAVPTFTPYIEIPELDRYAFKVVRIDASGSLQAGKDGHLWQYPDSEIDKLRDPNIKAFFLVNPSNPPSVTMSPRSLKRIADIVKKDNPNLIVITDDVYGTFVDNFRSLMAEVPQNTIGVYSYSKYFGCTGWRLGVVAVHENNIFDRMIAELPAPKQKALNKRYSTISLTPAKIKFIDRMVADSRSVALNHTAGLSLPQQCQMMLFSLFALADKKNRYKKLTQNIVQRRLKDLWKGLGLAQPQIPYQAGYYIELDLMVWAETHYGADFAEFLKTNFEPVDVLFRLAERFSIVLMDGGGFGGPRWSVRVSLANLPDAAYRQIGAHLAALAPRYVNAWKEARAAQGQPVMDVNPTKKTAAKAATKTAARKVVKKTKV
jgi:aspartate 4-decarboxylase